LKPQSKVDIRKAIVGIAKIVNAVHKKFR
jgi:hypothetical protein